MPETKFRIKLTGNSGNITAPFTIAWNSHTPPVYVQHPTTKQVFSRLPGQAPDGITIYTECNFYTLPDDAPGPDFLK